MEQGLVELEEFLLQFESFGIHVCPTTADEFHHFDLRNVRRSEGMTF